MREAVDLDDGDAPMARLRGEFRAYPALPDPGVPDDLDHLTFAPACALEDGFERRDLVVPADEL